MKCPKCGYLGFETSDRCRNCGYDFSLAVPVAAAELPLRSGEGAGEPLADLVLGERSAETADKSRVLDLDRLIGSDPPAARGAAANARRSATAPEAPSAPGQTLPLFGERDDDTPLITTPRPVRAPLSVRRTTPEIPRMRPRTVAARSEEADLAFPPESATDETTAFGPVEGKADGNVTTTALTPAAAGRRIVATIIDLALLASINAVVLYLTLALTGLTMSEVRLLPMAPIATFFVILDGGYLVAFIAASGQTIGKMLTGIRVLTDDGGRVDVGGAFLRAVGCGLSALTAGLGYLPAFVAGDRRALQDRISGTQVVSAR
jgi:uncharacterized RDD family membrane protein YckC